MPFYHRGTGSGPNLRVILALVTAFVVLMPAHAQASPMRNPEEPVAQGSTENPGISYQASDQASTPLLDVAGHPWASSIGGPSVQQSAWWQTGLQLLTSRVVPAAPSNVRATWSGTAVKVSWNDNASNETGYQLQRCIREFSSCSYQTAAKLQANVTYYEDTGLTAGTYRYRVRACNGTSRCSPYVESGAVTVSTAPSGGANNATPSPVATPVPSPSRTPTPTPTPTPTSSPAPTIAPSTTSPFVISQGTALYLGGQPFRFVGVNRFNLLTIDPGGGHYRGCGDSWTDNQIDQWFSEVKGMGATAVRFWAFQKFTASGADFSQMDKLLTVAGKYGVKLVPVLENQWSDCTAGGYKSDTWYQSGYLAPYDGYTLSYRDYVGRVVSRYRNDPRILMWQIMNEAEADHNILYAFAADVSGLIKSIDPNHLVSLGTIGSGQLGAQGSDEYRHLHSIPSIDLLEYHDYDNPSPLPGDGWNGLKVRLADAVALNKPLFVGEAGISLATTSAADRASVFDAKLAASFQNGVAGYLIWIYRDASSVSDKYSFDLADPLAAVLTKYAAQN